MLFSIHPRIRNKTPFKPEYSRDWTTKEGDLKDLRNHVRAGGAFIAAAMTSSRRSSAAFKSSELAVVDVDHGLKIADFQAHPLAAQAAYIYTTHSHTEDEHRYRIVFRLPKVITSASLYKAIVTILVRSVGGDKACTDACRIFYGNSSCDVHLWQPDAVLSDEIIQQGKDHAALERAKFDAASSDFEPDDILKAIFCLEEIINPTVDNNDERAEKFLPITMACNAVGSALFPAWSDWAFRGYHGKKNGQSSERYFLAAKSNQHTLGTIFHFANKDDPDWRSKLPDELKPQGEYNPAAGKDVVGYEFSAYTDGQDEDWDMVEVLSYERFAEVSQNSSTTSIFDPDRPWTGDGIDWDSEPDIPETAEEAEEKKRGRGRPRKTPESPTQATRKAVQNCYPDLRYNTTQGTYEYGPTTDPKLLGNDMIERAYLQVSWGEKVDFQKQLVKDCICTLAEENKYSPVVTYLNHCSANAKPIDYFDKLASTLIGSPEAGVNNPVLSSGQLFHDAILERFFIGAVARALNPGVTHDWMPILIGSQACGKTSFLQYITPPNKESNRYEWCATIQQDLPALSNRPHKLHAGWIVVLDECERYFHRRYVEQLKNMVSTSVDRSDLKYRNEMNFPRTFVLAGACNSPDFLSDPTGNRRFMPVMVEGVITRGKRKIIDLDRVKADRDRIWAAAFRAYQDKPVHTFDSGELAQVADYVDNFSEDNPLETEVLEIINRGSAGFQPNTNTPYWTIAYLMNEMKIPIERQMSVTMPVADVLKRHGYTKRRYKPPHKKNPITIWIERSD